MFGWFKTEKITEPADNIYTVLNDELERMHDLLESQMKANVENNGNNAVGIFGKINDMQDALVQALKTQQATDEMIKDLQSSIADLYLAGKDG